MVRACHAGRTRWRLYWRWSARKTGLRKGRMHIECTGGRCIREVLRTEFVQQKLHEKSTQQTSYCLVLVGIRVEWLECKVRVWCTDADYNWAPRTNSPLFGVNLLDTCNPLAVLAVNVHRICGLKVLFGCRRTLDPFVVISAFVSFSLRYTGTLLMHGQIQLEPIISLNSVLVYTCKREPFYLSRLQNESCGHSEKQGMVLITYLTWQDALACRSRSILVKIPRQDRTYGDKIYLTTAQKYTEHLIRIVLLKCTDVKSQARIYGHTYRRTRARARRCKKKLPFCEDHILDEKTSWNSSILPCLPSHNCTAEMHWCEAETKTICTYPPSNESKSDKRRKLPFYDTSDIWAERIRLNTTILSHWPSNTQCTTKVHPYEAANMKSCA